MKKKKLNIIVLVLIAMFTSIATVFAERIIASSNVTYSNRTSGLTSTNVQGAIDELYEKTRSLCADSNNTFVKYLKNCLTASDTVIVDDGTADHNMRYTGIAPNNYVTFNGELWRVIGVFNNIDNGSGTKETRVKIIKDESIGNKQWHTSNINIWKNASLNAELQSLSYASNIMVENAVWYLGDSGSRLPITKTAYEKERSATIASGNDPTWIGKVGLMYPSDYGFASSGCKDGVQTLYYYGNATCKDSNWLFLKNGSFEWLLSPVSDSTTFARGVNSAGPIGHSYVNSLYVVRPAVYLKSSVTCKNCAASNVGTKENPFQIG